jgi:hypothetical protein
MEVVLRSSHLTTHQSIKVVQSSPNTDVPYRVPCMAYRTSSQPHIAFIIYIIAIVRTIYQVYARTYQGFKCL